MAHAEDAEISISIPLSELKAMQRRLAYDVPRRVEYDADQLAMAHTVIEYYGVVTTELKAWLDEKLGWRATEIDPSP